MHVSVKCNITILLVVNVTEEQIRIECRWNNTDRNNQITLKNLSNFHFILQKCNMWYPRIGTETPLWEAAEEVPEP